MDITNILFHAFEGAMGIAVEDAAFSLAETHHASLTALTVVDNTPFPSYAIPYVPPNMMENYIAEAQREAQRVKKRVKEHAAAGGVHLEWHFAQGMIREILNQHSRYTDLVVLAQGTDENAAPGSAQDLPGEFVLTSGRPAIVVPLNSATESIGKRVVVAWNASAQSARAANDALPILKRANAVKILTIGTEGVPQNSSAEIAAHMVRHGVSLEVDHVVEEDLSTGEAIVESVRSYAADLIVMGAWGHSRLLETVMGGVTRHMLHHLPVPIFISH